MNDPTVEVDQEKRRERYRAICDKYDVGLNKGYSGGEDALEILEGEVVLGPWVLVTHNGDLVYAKPFDNLVAAVAHAELVLADDIYNEVPLAVVHLDDPDVKLTPEVKVEWFADSVKLEL